MTSLTRMRYAVQRAIRGLAWPAATGALAAVAAGGLVPTAAAQAATPAYTITDLGHLGYPFQFACWRKHRRAGGWGFVSAGHHPWAMPAQASVQRAP